MYILFFFFFFLECAGGGLVGKVDSGLWAPLELGAAKKKNFLFKNLS